MHKSITFERIENAVFSGMFGLENPGFCHSCGAGQGGCEPDARNYPCECCGALQVFGAEETMLML